MMKTYFRNRDGNTAPYLQAYQPCALSRGTTSSESEVKGSMPKMAKPLSCLEDSTPSEAYMTIDSSRQRFDEMNFVTSAV
jgi:hypothetical protein